MLSTEARMATQQVKREEFEINDRGITHKPTGATYRPYPGTPFTGRLNRSQLGNVRKRSEGGYAPFEVEEMMDRLWAEYVNAKR
jgi:hypothetical protein